MTASIEQRKLEMFAAQTLAGHLAREIYAAQQRGDTSDAVGQLIEQRAHAEATWLRLAHEVSTETMAKNLLTFLDRQDEGNARVVAAVEEVARGLGKRIDGLEEGQGRLREQISDLGERLSEAEMTLQVHEASRDASIAERKELARGREENAAAIAMLREEIERINQTVRRIEAHLTGEERQAGGNG